MLINRHGHKTAVKDLVFVVIDNHTLCIVVLRSQESIEPDRVPESVVEHGRCIADSSQVVERITIELFDHVRVELGQEGLVEELDRNDDVLHIRLRVLVLDLLECSVGVAETIGITPAGSSCAVATMIEAILGFGCPVEINDDLQSGLPRPANSCIKIRSSSLCIWTPGFHVGPVPNGNANDVEAGVLDLPEVVQRYKAVPMWFQCIIASLFAQLLAQGPFIVDLRIGAAILFEYGWSNEALQDEPAANVDAPNFFAAPIEGYSPLMKVTGKWLVVIPGRERGDGYLAGAPFTDAAAASRAANDNWVRIM